MLRSCNNGYFYLPDRMEGDYMTWIALGGLSPGRPAHSLSSTCLLVIQCVSTEKISYKWTNISKNARLIPSTGIHCVNPGIRGGDEWACRGHPAVPSRAENATTGPVRRWYSNMRQRKCHFVAPQLFRVMKRSIETAATVVSVFSFVQGWK